MNVVRFRWPASMVTPWSPLFDLIRSGARVHVPSSRIASQPLRSRSTSMAAPARVAAESRDFVVAEPVSVLIVCVRSMKCPKMNGPVATPALHASPWTVVDDMATTARARNVFCMMAVRFATGAPVMKKLPRSDFFHHERRRSGENPKSRLKPEFSGSHSRCGRFQRVSAKLLSRHYLCWPVLRSGKGHDDTGFDRFETSFARVPSY